MTNGMPKRENKLPKQIEKLLAMSAVYFAQAGQTKLQRIIVNALPAIEEDFSWANWDGGIAGHRLHLQIPAELYYEIMPNRAEIEKTLADTINKLARVDGEFVDGVVVEPQESTFPRDWRELTGLVIRPSSELSKISDADINRVWDQGHFRIFLSHKSDYKVQTAALKDTMRKFGVSCFVAHEDIEPTREWQDEIEKALLSAESLVVLLTVGFHQSNWTDQEIGIAIGRGIPIIPVRAGVDPYGFIGKYQALQAIGKKPTQIAKIIFDLLWAKPELKQRLAECIVGRLENSNSFEESNALMEILLSMETIPDLLVRRIESAVGANAQVAGAYRVDEGLLLLKERVR